MAFDMFNCSERKLMVVFLFYVAISKTLAEKQKRMGGNLNDNLKIKSRISDLERVVSEKRQNLPIVDPVIYKRL